jgi:hypothetical protein
MIGLIARALALGEIAAFALRDKVIPAWPPSKRTFPEHIARRLEKAQIFESAFADDLGTLLGLIAARIKDDMQVGWEPDENHVRGGYEVYYADDATHALIQSGNDLQVAREAITGVLYAVRAMRIADELLEA